MNKRITFLVNDTTQLTERITGYFKHAGFQLNQNDWDKLNFTHSVSILEAWKTNPLKWGSDIFVSHNGNQVTAEFRVDTESQLYTIEEEKVWTCFIDNFQTFLQNKIAFIDLQNRLVQESKKSRLNYLGWTVLGALTGGLIGLLLSKYSENKMVSYSCIPIFATLFVEFYIRFKRRNNAF